MERVTFRIESTGDQLVCLLNPESVVMRRWAGVRPRRSIGALVRRAGLADDPLLFTGGGVTELNLDLLFDVGLAGSTIASSDVRDLTRPFWQLSENAEVVEGYGRPPLVHFLWGKGWDFFGVVAAAAERLEHFDQYGAPRRSWMRMRLLRVAEPTQPADGAPEEETLEVHEVEGGGSEPPEEISGPDLESDDGDGDGAVVASGERLDELAARYYGDPSLWRLIAVANTLADPVHLTPGAVLRIPRPPTKSVV
jgi:hypothetical protein